MMIIGIPKYSRSWSLLFALGFFGLLLQRQIGSTDKQWLGMCGGLCLAAAMTLLLVGSVAGRKQPKTKENPEPTDAAAASRGQ